MNKIIHMIPNREFKLNELSKINSSASEIDNTRSVNQNTVVIDGDSIAAQNGYKSNGTTIYAESSGFFTWANILLNNRMNLLKNNGVGGERTDQLLTRLQASVDLKPRFMIINIGKNDISQSIAVSTIKANLLEIITRIQKAGIICVMNNIIPYGTSNTTQIANIYSINNYLRDLQSSLKDFILVDAFESIVNPSTDIARTNMLVADNIHPSVQGAYNMGKYLANAVDKYLPNINIFQGGNGDLANSFVTNGYLLGGTTDATSWTITINSGLGVKSKVARSNALEWQQVEMTALGDFFAYQSIFTNFLAGEKYKLVWEYELDSGAIVDNYGINCTIRDATSIISTALGNFIASGTTPRFPTDITKGIIETPVFTIPSNAVRLIPYFTAKLTGKIRFGRCRFIKVA